MNVLIVATNRDRLPVAVMPLGACMVAEAVRDAGHHVRLIDLMFEKDPLKILAGALRQATPDIIGLSVRNIDNNDMRHPVFFFEELVPMMRVVRAHTTVPVVLGGAALGVMPEAFLHYSGADYAVLGSGKTVFPQLLAALSIGNDPKKVRGIAWIERGRYRENGQPEMETQVECAMPDFGRWLNTRAYFSRLSSAPIQTKLGCPFRCVYCTYPMSEGRSYRLCSPKSVAAAVQRMVGRGMNDIEFVDNVFNSPYEHAVEICGELARARSGARFQTVELNPRFVDDRLFDVMETAGFTGIGITPESAADEVLQGLQKGYTSEDVRRAAAVIARHRLPAFWMFMLGGPGETKDTVRRTLQFAADHIRPKDVAFFNVGVRIYPGTELETIARRENVLSLSRDQMFRPVNYVSPEVDADWITDTVRRYMERHNNFIDSDSLNLQFLPNLFRLGYHLGFRPPLWRHVSRLRRGFRLLGAQV